jgi:hypothetical protein
MDPQHPPNLPDDLPDHSTEKDADAPIIPSMKVQPEPELQAYGNDNLTWQGQSEHIDGHDAVPVHSHDEDLLDHEVCEISRLERLRIQLKACRVMTILIHDRTLILRSEELGVMRELITWDETRGRRRLM